MSSLKCCCNNFEEALSQQGEAGLSCVVDRHSEGFFAKLQIRGCSQEDSEKLKQATIKDLPIKIRVLEEQGIRFCPWCSMDLEKWLNENTEVAEDVYNNNRHLLDTIA